MQFQNLTHISPAWIKIYLPSTSNSHRQFPKTTTADVESPSLKDASHNSYFHFVNSFIVYNVMTVLQPSNDAQVVIQILYLVLSECLKEFWILASLKDTITLQNIIEDNWITWNESSPLTPMWNFVKWFIVHTVKMD